MARIAGINIPPQQHAEIGLTAIYGIGRSRAREILTNCGIEFSKKVKDLTDADLEKIREQVGKFTVGGDLRREIQLSIKRLIDLWHLSWYASPQGSSLPRSAYSYECSHS